MSRETTCRRIGSDRSRNQKHHCRVSEGVWTLSICSVQDTTMNTNSPNRTDEEIEQGIDSPESDSQDEEEGAIHEDGDDSVSSGCDRGSHGELSTRQQAAQEERSTLGKQESQAILYLRWIVLLLLVVVGATFAALVFHFVRKQQEDKFEGDFQHYAKQVTDRFESQLRRTLDAQDTLSTEMTSYALDTESIFPFVTLPDFEFKGANARITGGTTMIYYMPQVKEN